MGISSHLDSITVSSRCPHNYVNLALEPTRKHWFVCNAIYQMDGKIVTLLQLHRLSAFN